MSLCDSSIHALISALNKKKTSSVELTTACLTREEETRELEAFLHVDGESALALAMASDRRRADGRSLGPLDGIPIALKDNILTAGVPTTCGSRMLTSFIPPYDATVVERLTRVGGVPLGKVSMDEFAMGSSNEHCAWGRARNPWNPSKVAGGSSGGSAVAVASGAALASLGTDTGGSVRQPAAFCGLVGLKPTYGRVSRYGVIAFASSLDQVGPITKDVTDSALVLQSIAGFDPRDSTSTHTQVPNYLLDLEAGVCGLRIGVPREYFVEWVDAEVRTAVQGAIDIYGKLGAKIVEISLPHTAYATACYYVLCTAEASSNLARFDGVRYGIREDPNRGLSDMYSATRGAGFGTEVKRRIMLGTFVLSSGYHDDYYLRAQKVRTLVCNDFAHAFSEVDALIAPTTPTTAFDAGAHSQSPLEMYLADVYTVGCNLAGIPGISIPCGSDSNTLPIGMQILGPHWSEPTLLRLARAYERETRWHEKRWRP